MKKVRKLVTLFLIWTVLFSNFAGTVVFAADTNSNFKIEDGVLTKYTGPDGVVTIPSGVTGIKECAFDEYYAELTGIVIPSSVTNIEEGAFFCCKYLETISVSGANKNYCSNQGILFSKDKSVLVQYPAAYKQTSYTIPSSVTSLRNAAFEDCTRLTKIIIPSNVTSIGSSAFAGCTSLTSIAIPNSVVGIGTSAFSYCLHLAAINVNGANKNYCSDNGILFNKNKSMLVQYPAGCANTYTIPSSVSGIGDSAFEGCTGLTGVVIPNSVTNLGNDAFQSCLRLTSIVIPNSVTSIGKSAFNCSGLTQITIPDSVTEIRSYLFKNCTQLANVALPNSVTSIGESAFEGCTTLAGVTIPNSVTSIGGWAFQSCSRLTSITIPNSVTTIGDHAFQLCAGLTQITLPNNVTSIGESAFGLCKNLADITIPKCVTKIGDYAFYGTTVTISCNKNTYAQTYAKQNRITFKLLDTALTTSSTVPVKAVNRTAANPMQLPPLSFAIIIVCTAMIIFCVILSKKKRDEKKETAQTSPLQDSLPQSEPYMNSDTEYGEKTEPQASEIRGIICLQCGHSCLTNTKICPTCGRDFTAKDEQTASEVQ